MAQHQITMNLLDELKSAASDPRRFLGRKARECRQCHGTQHYVNRAGGIVCTACTPPGSTEAGALHLDIANDAWIDAAHGFETKPIAPPNPTPAARSPATPSRFEQQTAARIERAMHAFAADYREWGWIDAREIIEFDKFAKKYGYGL